MPGRCFASATSSASEPTPSFGCTASTTGWRDSWMTGTKSFSGSKLTLNTCGALVTWSGAISTV